MKVRTSAIPGIFKGDVGANAESGRWEGKGKKRERESSMECQIRKLTFDAGEEFQGFQDPGTLKYSLYLYSVR